MSAADLSEEVDEYISVSDSQTATYSKPSIEFLASLSQKFVSLQTNSSAQRWTPNSPDLTEIPRPSPPSPIVPVKTVTSPNVRHKKVSLPPPMVAKRSVSPRRHSSNSDEIKSRIDYRAHPVALNSNSSLNLPSSSNVSKGGLCSTSVSIEEVETLMLPDLVRKYSKSLPLRVRVEEGYCGSEERFVISSGDIYNFHFMKSEKVASIQDCGNRHFSIPFNSDIQFGLLFNPNDNFKKAICGHTFASVSDLIASKTMPKIIVVVSSSQTQTGDRKSSLVEPNEVLIVKKIGKTLLRKPFLKVYSHTCSEEKLLLEDYDASFSTDPCMVKLYLPELLELFSNSYPLEAMMFTPNEDLEDLPEHLTTDRIVITHTSIESAIIATTCWDLEDTDLELNTDSEETIPISIPIDMEVELTLLNIDNDDLFKTTKSFLNTFDFSKVMDMKMGQAPTESMVDMKKCQYKLSKRIRRGYEFRGVDITMSDKFYDGHDTPFRTVLNQPLPPIPFETLTMAPTPQPKLSSPLQTDKKSSGSPKAFKSVKEDLPPVPPHKSGFSMVQEKVQSLDANQIGMKNKSKLRSLSEDLQGSPVYNRQPQPNNFQSLEKVQNISSDKKLRKVKMRQNSDCNDTFQAQPVAKPTSKLGREGVKLAVSGRKSEDEVFKFGVSVNSMNVSTEAAQNDCQKQLCDMRAEMKLLTELVEGMRAEWQVLRMELEDMKGKPLRVLAAMEPPSFEATKATNAEATTDAAPPSMGQEEENLKALRELSTQEIISLLDVMELSQYKESFVNECIDGEVLSECDENILQSELGIHDKQHLTKFMKLITGRHSAHHYFTDDYDPYGEFLS